MTMLRRLGNKSKISSKLIKYFPPHRIYYEPFFGAGGMFFNKHKVPYNFLNDNDDDVYNLFRQLLDNKKELIMYMKKIPITQTQYIEWSKGKREKSPLLNAVRFLVLSNFGYMGKMETLSVRPTNSRKMILENIDKCFDYLKDAYFTNVDFRIFFDSCSLRSSKERADSFIYADPPYLGTINNYAQTFTEKDSNDLFNILQSTGIKWAMSEFNNPFILEQVKIRNLNVVNVGERTNLKNRRTEILIMNYEKMVSFFK